MAKGNLSSFKMLSNKYVLKNKRNTISVLISLVLSVSMLTSVFLLQKDKKSEVVQRVERETGTYNVRVLNVDQEKLGKLENSDLVKDFSLGKSFGTINLSHGDGTMELLEVYGLEKKAYDNVFGFNIIDGRLPENENEVLVQGNVSKAMGQYYKVGDEITLDLETNRSIEKYNMYKALELYYNKGVPMKEDREISGEKLDSEFGKLEKETKNYKVVGIVDTGDNNYIWGNRFLTLLESSTAEKDSNLEVFTYLNKEGTESKLAEEIGAKFIKVKYSDSIYGVPASDIKYSGQQQLIGGANQGIVIGIIAVAIFCLIAILNIFSVALEQKLKYYGVLRAIGATMKQVMYLIVKETLILFIISVPIGLILGVATVNGEFKILNNIFNLNHEFTTTLSIIDYLIITFVMLFIVAMAVRKTIKKSKGLTPIQAITGVKKEKRGGLRLISLDSMSSREELESEEAIEEGEETFAEILEFNKTTWKYRLMTRIFKFEGALAHQNNTRDAARNRISIVALSITTMVILAFFLQFVNGSIAASNPIVSSYWDVEATNSVRSFSQQDIEEILTVEGVKSVYINNQTSVPVILKAEELSDGLKQVLDNSIGIVKAGDNYSGVARIRGLDEKSYNIYEQYLLEGTLDKEALDKDGVVLVSKNSNVLRTATDYVYKDTDPTLKLKIGDEIAIGDIGINNVAGLEAAVNNNSSKKLKIVGIISEDAFLNTINTRDLNNLTTNFTMITSNNTYEKVVATNPSTSLLIETSSENRDETIKELTKVVGIQYGKISDQIEKARVAKVNNILNLSYGIIFGITIVLMAMMNLIVTITANILSRRKELATLSAIGMSEKQKNRMIIAECFNVGLTSSIMAGVSIGFIGLISQFVNARAGKVSIIFVAGIILLILVSMWIFATLVSIVPLQAIKKETIVDTLKEEI